MSKPKKKTANRGHARRSGAKRRHRVGGATINLNVGDLDGRSFGTHHRPIENMTNQAIRDLTKAQQLKAQLTLDKLSVEQRGPRREIDERVKKVHDDADAAQRVSLAQAEAVRARTALTVAAARARADQQIAQAKDEAAKQSAELKSKISAEQAKRSAEQREQDTARRKEQEARQDAIDLQQIEMKEKDADGRIKMAEHQIEWARQAGGYTSPSGIPR